jgi:hypothetical protein
MAAQKEADRQAAIAAREAAKPTMMGKVAQTAATTITRQVANEVSKAVFGGGRGRSSSGGIAGQLVRGILGGLFK